MAEKECLRLVAYRCPAGVWTIGRGETEGVVEGMRWTKEQADQRLCQQLTAFAHRVQSMCNRAPNVNQLGTLVCFAYNVGLGGLFNSTVPRQFNAGHDIASATAFSLYNEATVHDVKQVVPDLVAGRASEAALQAVRSSHWHERATRYRQWLGL